MRRILDQPQNIYDQQKAPYIQQNDFLNQISKLNLFSQLLNLQNSVIKELIINKNLIEQYTAGKELQYKNDFDQKITEKTTKTEYNQDINSSKPSSLEQIKQQKTQKRPQIHRVSTKTKKVFKQFLGESEISCYDPSQQYSSKVKTKKSRQTKHIPKNYGKSILKFIKKNPEIIKKLCNDHQVDIQQFYKVAQSYKHSIYTINNLRSMWIEEENPLAKLFRIITMHYLRKHSLSHVFNSRVLNFSRHVKYRYKIIEAVQNPHEFNQIKDF